MTEAGSTPRQEHQASVQAGGVRRHLRRVAATGLLSLNAARRPKYVVRTPSCQDGEQVMFLPDIAYQNEAGEIVASIQAWVYRKKQRRRLAHILARIFGVDINTLDEKARQIFDARTQLFMVDSGHGCQLHVLDGGGGRHALPVTGTDGRTSSQLRLPETVKKTAQLQKISLKLDGQGVLEGSKDVVCSFIPPHGTSIISDIDDTIKQSFVNDKKKLLRNTFLEEYKAVPEMSDWYQSLARKNQIAFHYVSSSPIQLYPCLYEFMRTEHYPEGSIHLREATRWSDVFPRPGSSKQHKKRVIGRLLQTFPKRRFILIGDSSGDDPLIYADIARHYPHQIVAICIRCVIPTMDRWLYDKIFAHVSSASWRVSDRVSEMRQFIEQLDVLHEG